MLGLGIGAHQGVKIGYDITADKVLTGNTKIAKIWVKYNHKSSLHPQHGISHHNSEGQHTK